MSPTYTRLRHVLIPVNLAIRYHYSKHDPSMSFKIFIRTRALVQSINYHKATTFMILCALFSSLNFFNEFDKKEDFLFSYF